MTDRIVVGDFEAVLDGVRRVGMEAARRAEEIDANGAIPTDLFEQLAATGCLGSMIPRELGGLGLTAAEVNELMIEAARANGSLGWILMVTIPAPTISGLFPMETLSRLSAEDTGPPRGRGAIAPKGVAVPVDGGYTVSGQWPFASGPADPQLLVGNCIVMENGAPRAGADGAPDTVLVMVPATQVELLDTWHALGLRGSDSCDFALRDVFVPEAMTTNVYRATNVFDMPATRVPLRVFLATGHASVAIGIALGALDDITEISKTKRSAMNPTVLLADDPVFRYRLGENALRVESATALLERATQTMWEAGLAGRALTQREVVMGRTMAAFVTSQCVEVVDAAYSLAGSVSVYDDSSLQRRLRDIHTATQHVAVSSEPYRSLGAVILGEELTPRELF